MPAITHGDAQDLLARYKRSWETRDVDALLELFAEGAEHRPDPFEPALVGVIAIRAWANATFADIAHVDFDAERIWLSGNTVVSVFHAAWTERATADRRRVRGCLIAEVDDALDIRRLREWSRVKIVGRDSTFEPDGDLAAVAATGR